MSNARGKENGNLKEMPGYPERIFEPGTKEAKIMEYFFTAVFTVVFSVIFIALFIILVARPLLKWS